MLDDAMLGIDMLDSEPKVKFALQINCLESVWSFGILPESVRWLSRSIELPKEQMEGSKVLQMVLAESARGPTFQYVGWTRRGLFLCFSRKKIDPDNGKFFEESAGRWRVFV